MIEIMTDLLHSRQGRRLTAKPCKSSKITGVRGERIGRKTLLDPAVIQEYTGLAAQVGCGLGERSGHRANDTIMREMFET